MIDNIRYFEALELHSFQASEIIDLRTFGTLLRGHHRQTKRRCGALSNFEIDDLAMRNGELGGL